MRKILSVGAMIAVIGSAAVPAAIAEHPEVIDILVVSETAGFRHTSIENGMQMIEDIAANETFASVDFTVTHMRNSYGEPPVPTGNVGFGPFSVGNPGYTVANNLNESLINDEYLAAFELMVFISTTGNIFDDDEKAAFQRWVQSGGGYVGIHASSDSFTGNSWPWYDDFVGGHFRSHPAGTPNANVLVEDGNHISTVHLNDVDGGVWNRNDEWYNFTANPREYPCFSDSEATCGVRVLLTMDTSSYNNNVNSYPDGSSADDHPIAWCNEWDGGRVWYTGLGHTNASYTEPAFVAHVTGGLLAAAGLEHIEDSPDFADLAAAGVTFDCEPAAAE